MATATDITGRYWKTINFGFQLAVSGVVIVAALLLLIYPAVIVGLMLTDSQLRRTGQCRLAPTWFESATGRFGSWADGYLATNFAGALRDDDIPGTEWPMFGAVFFLVTAEDLQQQGQLDTTRPVLRQALQKAAQLVASPVTGTWVRRKWGPAYRDRENVFYRMLLILGLASYERVTADKQYHTLMADQRDALAAELGAAKFHLRDDYPGECYPADMLWAVAAIQRAGRLDGLRFDALARGLMADFDGPLKTPHGLPAFQANSRTGCILQAARGVGNSGILLFASELDAGVAARWYADYEMHFWKDNGWIAGFSELPLESNDRLADVDSGPVVAQVGTVATFFGIGAARMAGRADHAAPMAMQVVACSWPTPFGFLVPGLMGRSAAQSWSLGEVALLFSLTRPTAANHTVPFTGRAPLIVWIMLLLYAGSGTFFIGFELRSIRRMMRKPQAAVASGRRAATDGPAVR